MTHNGLSDLGKRTLINRVVAEVIGPVSEHTLRIKLLPDRPEDGSVLLFDVSIEAVPMKDVPADLRVPNSKFWLLYSDGRSYEGIERIEGN